MKRWIVAVLFASLVLVTPLQAGDSVTQAEVWTVFKDMGGNVITPVGENTFDIGANQQFKAEVWFRADANWSHAFVAFQYGIIDGATGLITDDFSISNRYVDPDEYFDNHTHEQVMDRSAYGGPDAFAYGDMNYIDAKINRYGGFDYLGITYTVLNNMAVGQTGKISIHSSNTFMTYIDGIQAPEVEYTLKSIPEPSSLMAMGCAGVGVLGNLLHRRRKKTSAKS